MLDPFRDTFCWHLQAELEALASLSLQAVALPQSPYTSPVSSQQGYQQWLFWPEAGVESPKLPGRIFKSIILHYKLIP